VNPSDKGIREHSQGKASYSNASQSSSFNFNAKVTSDLNEQELSDIASVIKALQTGASSTSALSSLAAYSGAYQQTTSVTNSSLRLYA
jgi:pyruvate/2-oxoacid:ferredoxin oxidoreductase alpha subunit